MATGIVKWFNNQKGYGFICTKDTQEEVFAHFSAIVMQGYKSLKAGQSVNFEINQGPKGLHALNITPESEHKNNSSNTQVQGENKFSEKSNA